MLGKRGGILGFLVVAAVPLALAGSPGGYVVVLQDGSFVRAEEKPVVEGDLAQVRLPGGLLARIPAARIDWKRSEARSRRVEVASIPSAVSTELPPAEHPVKGTLTLIGAPSKAAPAAAAPAPAPGAASPPEAVPADPNAELRAKVQALGDAIDGLETQKLALEEQIRKTIRLEEIPDLRRQVDEIDAQIKDKRAELSGLILQLSGPAQP